MRDLEYAPLRSASFGGSLRMRPPSLYELRRVYEDRGYEMLRGDELGRVGSRFLRGGALGGLLGGFAL